MEPTKSPQVDLTEVLGRAVSGGSGKQTVEDGLRTWRPPVDVKDAAGEFVVFADIPGVDEDEISLNFSEGVLRISAIREFDHDGEDAEEFPRIERPYGRFSCCIDLGQSADFDHATAKYRRGVLKVRLPKRRA